MPPSVLSTCKHNYIPTLVRGKILLVFVFFLCCNCRKEIARVPEHKQEGGIGHVLDSSSSPGQQKQDTLGKGAPFPVLEEGNAAQPKRVDNFSQRCTLDQPIETEVAKEPGTLLSSQAADGVEGSAIFYEANRLSASYKETSELERERVAPLENRIANEGVNALSCLDQATDKTNRPYELGEMALHSAVYNRNIEEVLCLASLETDVNLQDEWGKTALHVAAYNQDVAIMECLLDKGAKVNLTDGTGRTALQIGAIKGNTQMMALLFEKGTDTMAAVNISVSADVGRTALQTAIASGNQEMVALLLRYGADVNLQDQAGYTALHLAADKGYVEIVRLLLVGKVDMGSKDHFQETALDIAIKRKKWEVLLLFASKLGVNLQYQHDQTMLHIAAYHGDLEFVSGLLCLGAKVNVKDHLGRTALQIAAMRGNTKMVALLCEKGADTKDVLNIGADFGRTALHMAADAADQEMVKLLLAHMVLLNLQDDSGDTALHLAAYKGHKEIIRLLLAHGMDVGVKNDLKQTALDIAKEIKTDKWSKKITQFKQSRKREMDKQSIIRLLEHAGLGK
eukprot:gene749-927_t